MFNKKKKAHIIVNINFSSSFHDGERGKRYFWVNWQCQESALCVQSVQKRILHLFEVGFDGRKVLKKVLKKALKKVLK